MLQSCASDELTDSKKQEITNQIQDRIIEYQNAARELDIKKIYDFWANKDGFSMAADGSQIVGHADWEKQLDGMKDSYDKMVKWNVSNLNVFVLSEESASCTCEFEWSTLLKTGDTISAHGSWCYVFKKFDDKIWRVVQSGGAHIPDE